MTKKWTEADVPDQTGRVAIITGANSGIGYDNARVLAQNGATVVMACRNMQKANPAADKIRALNPKGKVDVMMLDLSDLASVRSFAETFRAKYDRLDLLINNAGIMAVPYATTKDGFESQFGVNHLAHFALTGLLLDMINATPNARIVNVSSLAHQQGRMDFNTVPTPSESDYDRQTAYRQSKLANLLFTYELQRKLVTHGQQTLATASHPGVSTTNLFDHMMHPLLLKVLKPIIGLFLQSAAMGALPTLRAAVDPAVKGGEYYGPDGNKEMKGDPVVVTSTEQSHDQAVAEKLWQVSEDLTGISFSFN